MSKLTAAQLTEVLRSIQIRMNLIETGIGTLSAVDAVKYNATLSRTTSFGRDRRIVIKDLGPEQKDLLNVLKEAHAALST